MCVPPKPLGRPPSSQSLFGLFGPEQHAKSVAASAKTLKEAGYTKDERLNYASVPGTSFNPMGFLELPIFLTLAFLYRAQFQWKLLGPMFVIYMWKECIPMSTCLHRYFSHKGFKCGRATQFGLYIIGCLASQVRFLWFVCRVVLRPLARSFGKGIKTRLFFSILDRRLLLSPRGLGRVGWGGAC